MTVITLKNIKRVCAASPAAVDHDADDMGNDFEQCPDGDNGHLYFHGECVHCNMPAPDQRGQNWGKR